MSTDIPSVPGPGAILDGKYRIDESLGSGGMGVVVSATDLQLGRSVAIKFLLPEMARVPGASERFLREARSAAAISGEHVVRVFEVSVTADGLAFLVMERLRGGDLGAVVRARGPLPLVEATDHVLEACEALAEAHAVGIVHRDLKPSNLFLTTAPDGSPRLKLLDFGISKGPVEAGQVNTVTQMGLGSPLYMSPEQIRARRDVDRRTDIWGLGVVLFELLTATHVFEAETLTALSAMIVADPAPSLRERRPDVVPELDAVFQKCLAKHPDDRFGDVAELAAALVPFAGPRGRAAAERVSRIIEAKTQRAPLRIPRAASSYPNQLAPSGTATGPATPYDGQASRLGGDPAGGARPGPARHWVLGMGALFLGLGVVVAALAWPKRESRVETDSGTTSSPAMNPRETEETGTHVATSGGRDAGVAENLAAIGELPVGPTPSASALPSASPGQPKLRPTASSKAQVKVKSPPKAPPTASAAPTPAPTSNPARTAHARMLLDTQGERAAATVRGMLLAPVATGFASEEDRGLLERACSLLKDQNCMAQVRFARMRLAQ